MIFVVKYKKIRCAALVSAALLGQSSLVHAGFLDLLKRSYQTSSSEIANASLTVAVQGVLDKLNQLSQQVIINGKQGQTRQVISDLIQIAQIAVISIQQGDHSEQIGFTQAGDAFFCLFQLQVNGQSPFVEKVRIAFLARALMVDNEQALVYLDQQIRQDIKNGVRRNKTNARWQQWLILRGILKASCSDNTDLSALIKDVDEMYQVKDTERKLKRLQEIKSDSDLNIDDALSTPSLEAQLRALEHENKHLTERLQYVQSDYRNEIASLKAQLQVALDKHRSYRLSCEQNTVQITENIDKLITQLSSLDLKKVQLPPIQESE